MSISMPLTFLHVPQIIAHLPNTTVTKDVYKKENRLEHLNRLYRTQNPMEGATPTVLDLPLKQIFQRILSTFYGLYNDLTNLQGQEISVRKIFHIISDGDRLVYIGIFLICVAILFMLGTAS